MSIAALGTRRPVANKGRSRDLKPVLHLPLLHVSGNLEYGAAGEETVCLWYHHIATCSGTFHIHERAVATYV